jgi:WD40 repeat protein
MNNKKPNYTVLHTLNDHKSPICSLYLTIQGPPYLISAGVDKLLTIHNTINGNCIVNYTLYNTPTQVKSSANNELIYVSQSNKMTVLSVKEGERLMEFQAPNATHLQKILCFQLDRNEKVIACGAKDAKVHLFDLVSRHRNPIMTLDDFTDAVTCIQFINNCIVCSCLDGRIRQYDVRNGKLFIDSMPGLESVGSITPTIDEKCIITAPIMEQHNIFRLMSLKNGDILNEYCDLDFHTNGLKIEISCSPCGQFFFSGDGFKRGVWCWNIFDKSHSFISASDGLVKKNQGYNCVSSSSEILVAGGTNGNITIWNKTS